MKKIRDENGNITKEFADKTQQHYQLTYDFIKELYQEYDPHDVELFLIEDIMLICCALRIMNRKQQ
jgi:hypothetical protein